MAPALTWLATRGRRLTDTHPDASGTVPDDPSDLAAAASAVLGRDVDVEDLALALMVGSEAGAREGADGRVARAWVAKNDLADLGRDSYVWLFTVKGGGKFGKQAPRRYATDRNAYEQDLQIAEAVRRGMVADPTGGGIKFLDVDSLPAQGARSLDSIENDPDKGWVAHEGLERVEVDGLSTYFYRRAA